MEETIDYTRAGSTYRRKLRIFTDTWSSYNFLDYMPEVFHGKLNHSRGWYGKKSFHSNTIENRWS